MGRTGGGSKHSGMSHSSSRGSSTHHSTRSSSRSSFSTSRNTSGFKSGSHSAPRQNTSFRTPPRGPAPGHVNFGGPHVPPPPRPPRPPRHYSGHSYRRSSKGAFTTLLAIIIVFALLFIFARISDKSGSSSSSFDNKITEYANDQYDKIFEDRQDALLIVVSESDTVQAVYGSSAAKILDDYIETMWEKYDDNYNDDLGIQLSGMFNQTLDEIKKDEIKPIKPEQNFKKSCYRDDLNWVDTKQNLVSACLEFYECTGIQPYVLLVKDRTIKNETNGFAKTTSSVIKVFIVAFAIIIVTIIIFIIVLINIIHKKKERDSLEETLKQPLETFSSNIDDLANKYDNSEN